MWSCRFRSLTDEGEVHNMEEPRGDSFPEDSPAVVFIMASREIMSGLDH